MSRPNDLSISISISISLHLHIYPYLDLYRDIHLYLHPHMLLHLYLDFLMTCREWRAFMTVRHVSISKVTHTRIRTQTTPTQKHTKLLDDMSWIRGPRIGCPGNRGPRIPGSRMRGPRAV